MESGTIEIQRPPFLDEPDEPSEDLPEVETPDFPLGPQYVISLQFSCENVDSAAKAWEIAHSLIQSAQSKGLSLVAGQVTDLDQE